MEPTTQSLHDTSVGEAELDLAPAHRDADEIVARAAADETAADVERERYLSHPIAWLDPDAGIAPLLGSDEHVVAIRRSAMLDRREIGSIAPPALGGDLYVTSRRLLLVGRVTLSFDLDEIDDVILSGERLLLSMRNGDGARIDVAEPRVLRVEIAAVRASAKRATEAGRTASGWAVAPAD